MRHILSWVCVIGLGSTCASIAAFASGPPGSYPTYPVVQVPAYGAGLVPGQDQQPDNAAVLKRIEDKLDRLLKIVEDAAKDEAAAAPKASAAEALSSGATKCAACHFPDVADQKGGGFKLFTPAGAFAALTPRQKAQASKRLTTTDPSFAMPPPKSGVELTPEERAALVQTFDSPK